MVRKLPVPPIEPGIVRQVQQSISEGKSQEEVFAQMRRLGLFAGTSIKLACELYGMTPHDAKIAVHYSATWADMRTSHEELHENAVAAAKQLIFEEEQEPFLQTAS